MTSNFAIIGSVAMKFHFGDFSRIPVDLDIMSKEAFIHTDVHWHPAFEMVINTVDKTHIVSPDILYTIKVSHSFWDIEWAKTMYDIAFLQLKDCKLNEPLYQALYKVWEEVHGKKKVNLNAKPKDFFSNTIQRIYEHDSIHASIAYSDKPLFTRILRTDSSVAVDQEKFIALSYNEKLMLVREEVYATALERYLIPSKLTFSPRAAYAITIKNLITSMSKGWFPKFIIENWTHLQRPDTNYLETFKRNQYKLILLKENNDG